jgi:hypothetical protein
VPASFGPAAGVARAAEALVSAVDAARPLGAWAGALVAVVGFASLAVATRFRSPLAVVGGAALGAVAAAALRGRLAANLGLSYVPAAAVATAVGGVACALRPALFPVAAGALPGALLGGTVPLAGSALLGAAAGAALGAVVGAAFARVVGAAFASALGAALATVGLAVALDGYPLAREIAARPFALAGVALVLAVAGAAFQLARRDPVRRYAPPPRVQERREPLP